MTDKNKPDPIENRPGKQMDDNIDDLGRRPDGTTQDQPVNPPHDGAHETDRRKPPGELN
jgi:hypothetical protein